MKKILLIIVTILLVCQIQGQQPQIVKINETLSYKFTNETGLTKRFQIKVQQSDIPKQQSRWYVFVVVQPKQKSVWQSTEIDLILKKPSQQEIKKKCLSDQGIDSCFINSRRFQPQKNHKLYADIVCKEECQFNITAQLSTRYSMTPNTTLQLDFQETAYTKIFTLRTDQQFDELRVILKAKTFLDFPAPVEMYANRGWKVPTQSDYQYRGFHLWDDGQGLFIPRQELQGGFMSMLTISITGPQKNVLLLQNTFHKYSNEPTKLQPFDAQFDYLSKQGSKKLFSFVIQPEKVNVSQYIRLMTFSGHVKFEKILNKKTGRSFDLTNLLQQHAEITYRLNKEQYNESTQIEVTVLATKRSTFLMEYYYDDEKAIYLKPVLSQYAEIYDSSKDQYIISVHQLQQNDKNSSKVSVTLKTLSGSAEIKFFECPSGKDAKCDLTKNELDNIFLNSKLKAVLPSQVDINNKTVIHYFEIKNQSFFSLEQDIKKYAFTAIVRRQNEDAPLQYKIQYNNNDRVQLLSEKQPKKDRLEIGEQRLYKYSNMDPDIKQIKVHFVNIAGQASYVGRLTDPRLQMAPKVQIKPQHQTLTFKNISLNSTIYVLVTGIQFTYYQITMQLFRQSQKGSAKNQSGYNELILAQRINYQFVIQPKGKMVFQGNVEGKQFILNLKTSLPLQLCMTEKLDAPPFSPNCEVVSSVTNARSQKLVMQRGHIVNIGVLNQNDKNSTIQIMIDSQKNQCKVGLFGQIMQNDLSDQNVTQMICTTYVIPTFKEIYISMQFSNSYADSFDVQISINNKETLQITSLHKKIKKQQIEKACSQQTDAVCKMTITMKNITKNRVYLLAQYTDKEIKLMDGFGYTYSGEIHKEQPRHFIYKLINLINTTIILQSKKGYYECFANVVPLENLANAIYPTSKQHDFQSANPYYFNHQMIFISQKKLKQKCKTGSCALLISVELNFTDKQMDGKFTIQTTQQVKLLKQHVLNAGYLPKNSIAFYQYQNEKDNGSIFITVHNQNKNCIKTYIKKGRQAKASQSDNLAGSQSGDLILKGTEKGIYSISLISVHDCHYTFEVTSSKNQVMMIQKGIYTDLTIEKGQNKYLIYENQGQESFKIVSIMKYGEMLIKIKGYKHSFFQNITQIDNLQNQQYDLSGKDFLRVNNKQKYFCSDCFYLINIKAIKTVQTSIIIPVRQVQIPISTNKIVIDELLKGEKQYYRVYTGKLTHFEITLYSGKLNISVLDQSKKQITNKVYTADKTTSVFNLEVKKPDSNITYDFASYNQIQISALQDAYYSFQMLGEDATLQGITLKYGLPQYIWLTQNQTKIYTGIISNPNQQFVISHDYDEKTLNQVLKIKLTINNTQYQLNNKSLDKVMLLQINNKTISQNSKFQIALISTQNMSISLIQSSQVNFLPQNSTLMFTNQTNLTFRSDGTNILELNQCKGPITISLSTQFNTIGAIKSPIKQSRRQNNIIQFEHYGPVYIHAESELGVINRLTKNADKGIGVGYDNYKPGKLRTYKYHQQLITQISPLITTQKISTKAQIQSLVYHIYYALQQRSLFQQINCDKGIKFKRSKHLSTKEQFEKSVTTSVPISQLIPEFSNSRYFLVGGIIHLTLKTESGGKQLYRFYLQYQQVQKQVLTGQEQVKPPIPNPKPNPNPNPNDNGDQPGQLSQILWLLLYTIALLAGIFIGYKIYKAIYRKYYRKPEQFSGMQMQYSEFA